MAERIGTNVGTKVAIDIVDKLMKEAEYLCCYKSYVDNFEEEKGNLSATRSKVLKDIEEAKNKNENQIEADVKLWLYKANSFIQEDIKAKKKWFGLCTNCFWQYQQGKELEEKTQKIKQLIEKSNFSRIARSTGLPGIKYYSSQNFMHFEDRKLKFEQLKGALKDDKKYMIGLQGMGGTGKTTMAIEVGIEAGESKLFDKVIFSVVSKDANVKKIQDNIAKHLDLPIEEGMDKSEQAKNLWKRIVEGGEKVLIILDDVWEKLSLRDIGIPLGRYDQGCCNVLLTTRDLKVCREMECQEKIQLEVLSDKDAVDLFLLHAGRSVNGSSSDFKDLALDIVKECGRLPVAVAAVARSINSKPLNDWKEALKRLQTYEPTDDVNEDLTEAYNSLRLSFDNLENEKAKQLFLLCSLFPEASEIPTEFLSRIAIGLGLCGKADKYYIARSQLLAIKNTLIDSCLLLKAEEECVKMHDLVREVALWIANEEIQAVMDSNTTLMENMRYLSWNINNFPNRFDGSKLEVLLVWINANPFVEVPDAFFEGMICLRVLILYCVDGFSRISAPSLLQPIQSIKNIRTLSIKNWNLEDISILGNLRSLETLELIDCSIIKLPDEVEKLEKLKLLGLKSCFIKRNNPLEVIGRCLQLEELYYVLNDDILGGVELPQVTTLPKLQRYHIMGRFGNYYHVDVSTSRYFNPIELKGIFSKEIVKSLAARAEVLELGKDNETGWTNLIPDVVPMEDGGMKDLIRLSLERWSEVKCLIHTEHLPFGVTIFSKLVELRLSSMNMKELCCGPFPVDFLKQLETVFLYYIKLESTLFKGKLDLGNLKFIKLVNCSIACLFHPSTAQSLKQLETLDIWGVDKLKYIIRDEGSGEEKVDDHDPNQKSHGLMFPKLKFLKVSYCDELEFILPICFGGDLPLLEDVKIRDCRELKYIFGQYTDEGVLYQMEKEIILPSLKQIKISGVPKFVNIYPECYLPLSSPTTSDELKIKDKSPSNSISWAPLCCFLPKSSAPSVDNPSTSSQALKAKCVYNSAQRFFTPPLYPHNLREMIIFGFSNLTSLFTLSIASSMSFLERLDVGNCDELKHLVTDEGDSYNHMNCNSIFPNLRKVYVCNCSLLESIFPASHSKSFVHLESMEISNAHQLKYVFGKCYCDDNLLHQNQNVEIHLDLPALKSLFLQDVPNTVNICTENYYLTALSLEKIVLKKCPQLPIRPFMDFRVGGCERQEDHSRRDAIEMRLRNLNHLDLENFEIDTIYDFEGLQIEREVKSSLQVISLQDLPELRDICVGSKDILSLQNLYKLTITGCKQLKVIFSASILRSLPKLGELMVSDCEELVCIIEENEQNPVYSHQICFPELTTINVKHCKTLECLFSISTCGALPKLWELKIEDAPELVQVFGCEQGDTQELVREDVLPDLLEVELINLPSLHSICQGIDFQTVQIRVVRGCPNISLTSTTTFHERIQRLRSVLPQMEFENYDFDLENEEEASKEVVEKDLAIPVQNNSSPNLTKSKETSEEVAEKGSTLHKQNNSSSNLTESTKAAANKIVEQFLISDIPTMTNPSSNSDMIKEAVETIVRESPKSKKAIIANQIKDSELSDIPAPFVSHLQIEPPQDEFVGKEAKNERIMMDQQALAQTGPDMHSNDSQNNIEATVAEGPSSEKYDKASSSTHLEPKISNPYTLTSTEINSISTPKKSQIATSVNHTESRSSQSDLLDISTIPESAKGKIKVNQAEISIDEEIKFDQRNPQQFEEDDLIRLFQIMEEGADMEVHMPYVSKIAALKDDNKVTKALADLEVSLKMGLNEIASSKESSLRLENALDILSSHLSEDGPPSHGLKATIDSLQEEIQSILSSFKQAYATIDTFTKLEEKEKFIIEERSQRKEAAITLSSKILKTKNSMAEAQLKEVELKEQISRLQAELNSKEKEIKECEIQLSSLNEQKKKSISDTIGFVNEFEAVKKERFQMVEDQIKARQELKNVDVKWSSCVANLRKTTLLLGIHHKQKL